MEDKLAKMETEIKGLTVINQEQFLEDIAVHVREFVKSCLEIVMEKELTAFLGYQPYQRGVEKCNYRNGYYKRGLYTRFGLWKVSR
jgi:transposase-like protein